MNPPGERGPKDAVPAAASAFGGEPGNVGEGPAVIDDETYLDGGLRGFGLADRGAITTEAIKDDPSLAVNLTLVAGDHGLGRSIAHSRIQKSGLALAGHFHGIEATRVQVLGQTERSYLASLPPTDIDRALKGFFDLDLSCVVLTGDACGTDAQIIEAAALTHTPVFVSDARSSVTITAIHALLDDLLAPRKRLHGVLVDVFGVGVMIKGPSGVGKSEAALDLVMRGHRLVADDAVECDFRPPGMIFGAPATLLRHHLEVRGLGVLNIKDLFGVTAIRERKRIDVVANLLEWSHDQEYDRLGLEERVTVILGVKVPELLIPVRSGRDMASILEVAARNELLKNAGHHTAREFLSHLEGALGVGPSVEAESAAPETLRRRDPESVASMPRVRRR